MRCLLLLLALFTAAAQTPPPPARFARVTVKPSDYQGLGGMGSTRGEGGSREVFGFFPMSYLVAFAYGVEPFQVSGPEWIGRTRYEIYAQTPPGTTDELQAAMFRTFLTERFGLKARVEMKTIDGLALTAEEGGILLPLAASGSRGSEEATPMTLDEIAQLFRNWCRCVVVNATGSHAYYLVPHGQPFPQQVRLQRFDEPAFGAIAVPSGWGLRVERRSMKAPFVVVESVERTPKAN